MIPHHPSRGPVPPTQGPRADAAGAQAPAAEAETDSWEIFWTIIGGMFAGLVIGGLVIWLLFPFMVDVAIKVLTS